MMDIGWAEKWKVEVQKSLYFSPTQNTPLKTPMGETVYNWTLKSNFLFQNMQKRWYLKGPVQVRKQICPLI